MTELQWITVVTLGGVAINLIAIAAHAEPTTRTFRDNMGRETGRATTNGNNTTFRDHMGRETGRAVRSNNGTTFYDHMGREIGRSSR